jgi:hypothetical protein
MNATSQEAMEFGVSIRENGHTDFTAGGGKRRETARAQGESRRRRIAENAKSEVR